MRIYSDFKDYYDVGLKYSIDEEPVYIRNQKEIPFGKTYTVLKVENHRVSYGMVYFLGNYYPFIELEEKEHSFGFHGIFYTMETLEFHLKNIMKESAFKAFQSNTGMRKYDFISSREHFQEVLDLSFTKRWASWNVKHRDMKDALVKHRIGDIPIAVFYSDWMGNQTIYTDCHLARYHFYKVMEAYTAFHTLETHLCNIARPENPVITISDTDLATSKGYDKWSFRKHSKNSKG